MNFGYSINQPRSINLDKNDLSYSRQLLREHPELHPLPVLQKNLSKLWVQSRLLRKNASKDAFLWQSKNENPKPSDAASHADPLSATAALTLSALLGFCSFLCRLYLAQGFFSLRFFFLSVKRICNVNLYTCIGQYTFGITSKYCCHTFVRVRKSY